jgi:hypothetical protein
VITLPARTRPLPSSSPSASSAPSTS